MNLTQLILNHFREETWKTSLSVRDALPPDISLKPLEVRQHIQALHLAHLLEKRGIKKNTEYRRTPAGTAALEAMREAENA